MMAELEFFLSDTMAKLKAGDLLPYLVSSSRVEAHGQDLSVTFITRDAASLAEEIERLKGQLAAVRDVVS
jgi:P2-related tail formation protein